MTIDAGMPRRDRANSLKKMNKLSSIKMVSFDLFGVILSEGHLISNVLMPLLPIASDKKRVKLLYEDYNIGLINEMDFWNGIGIRYYQELRSVFINSFQLEKDFESVVKGLKKKYQLSILSNLPSNWADELEKKFQFEKNFNPRVFSGISQCKKPQAKIYQRLLKQSQLKAENIAFIDDRLENLQTAYELGMTTIYFQKDRENHQYVADYQIKQFVELRLLFDV
ncbi:MAG: HAD-IA family hydrolase [gamma proteobacterium symbiont of Bathyaustriella thionipta]|nr:HAD-IA family hydrolase [gamma proteobacterium symbiont of Bathyaustriella thionipta]MCU7950764.1 HAD-IA family hydrolase [gamma proteobacterium symbiont of Bathyaustriella thionipta]MCU7952060.1 HAD-IA family hydrolase [gamma proteobacterium symbiont of Bathyaustriella thionipta]MCU7957268.1 HAD-IA family hydrolase [gamma proteobacterium symbiont of Bathyaustriella thionipta]MCU7966232.1 HAD-IA family hydrolase [gamma proteobacterium symbiont of Bathyaustriella thionipta]